MRPAVRSSRRMIARRAARVSAQSGGREMSALPQRRSPARVPRTTDPGSPAGRRWLRHLRWRAVRPRPNCKRKPWNLQARLSPHLELILLRPALFERHHEIGHEGHLLELPFAVALYVIVVVSRRHQKSLAVVDRLGFQIRKPMSVVAVKVDHVIVNELFDPRNSRPAFFTGRSFTGDTTKEFLQLRMPLGVA